MQGISVLDELVSMSRRLGAPAREAVILGEGNSSARADENSFWVKVSGAQLHNCGPEAFVQVHFEPVLEMLDGPELDDGQIRQALEAACVEPGGPRPSVETMFHALLLSYPDVHFVGHTHPVAVNSILCSDNWQKLLTDRLFPDEIVVCGEEYVLVPYCDPGLALSRVIRDRVSDFFQRHGEPPRTVLIQNHGLIALGKTAAMVDNITAMMDKTARIILGACAAGGVHALPLRHVERIVARPDEKYRQRGLDQA